MSGERKSASTVLALGAPVGLDGLADPRLPRIVLDSLQANLFVTDPKLDLRYMNPRASQTMCGLDEQLWRAVGLRADQLVGTSLRRFHSDHAELERVLLDARMQARPIEFKFGGVTLGGNVSQLRGAADELLGYVIAWADITNKINDSIRARRLNERLNETQEVNAAIQAVAGATERMASTVDEIARNAAEATAIVDRAVRSVASASETMGQLGEASEKINDIVRTITLVADQTNLLALNATIEAARAGTAGKGFAVVAGEVKELSKQTKSATERIDEMIAQVQTLSRAAINAIEAVNGVVGELNQKQHSIASTVERQTLTTAEICENAATAAQRAESIASFVAANRP